MDQKRMLEWTLHFIKMAFKTTTPWRENNTSDDYQRGWNACVEEIKKRQRKYLKNIEGDVRTKLKL